MFLFIMPGLVSSVDATGGCRMKHHLNCTNMERTECYFYLKKDEAQLS